MGVGVVARVSIRVRASGQWLGGVGRVSRHCGLLAVRRCRRLTRSWGDTISKPPLSCSRRAARTWA